jgi:hypothetical protein
MKRVGSQLCFCSPELILRRMAVEQNDENTVTRIFSLDDGIVESANTLFFDGILSAEIISLKQFGINNLNEKLVNDYQYIDISDELPKQKIIPGSKPLLLDAGTDSILLINKLLAQLAPALSSFSIYEIIAACTFYPALALNRTSELCVNRTTRLLLWENVDLVNKRITLQTRVREIV